MKITLYLGEENSIEAANVTLESTGENHCTADVRISDYTQNVTIVLSKSTSKNLLKQSMKRAAYSGAYKEICINVGVDISSDYYTYIMIDKKDFLVAINEQLLKKK